MLEQVQLDQLEARILRSATLKNGNLNVQGTASADQIFVAINPNTQTIDVTISGNLQSPDASFPIGNVTKIHVFAGDGNDLVNMGDLGMSDHIFNVPVTVYGGAGDDGIVLNNSVSARVYGEDGNDQVSTAFASPTNSKDHVYGGDGADTLSTGAGHDYISGDAGDDYLNAGTGPDLVYGGDGNDTIVGGTGNEVNGPSNDDTLFGEGGDDFIEGCLGDDSISGGDGNDTIMGDTIKDLAIGGNDTLSGDADDDNIDGYLGNDSILGGDGNDTLSPGEGTNTVTGGDGADFFGIAKGHDSEITDFQNGVDSKAMYS